MILDHVEILRTIMRLLAVSTLLQSIEMLRLRESWSDQGPWRWSLLREDFKNWIFPLPFLMDVLMPARSFRILLWLRTAASALFLWFPWPSLAIFLMLTTLLIAWRWRGSFNGGSDSMTVLTSAALSVALLFPSQKMILACLWFLAIQLTLSYCLAGFAKARQKNWWNGKAMSELLRSTRYATASAWLAKLAGNPFACRALSWIIIGFETLFPLAFLNAETAVAFLKIGVAFHLANVFLLGLNRFFWAWIATYPALLYCVAVLRG